MEKKKMTSFPSKNEGGGVIPKWENWLKCVYWKINKIVIRNLVCEYITVNLLSQQLTRFDPYHCPMKNLVPLSVFDDGLHIF